MSNTEKVLIVSLMITTCAAAVGFGITGSEIREKDSEISELGRSNSDLQARVEELRLRSFDRDVQAENLLACERARRVDLDNLENIKWQMDGVIKSCPGRVRPPKGPRL